MKINERTALNEDSSKGGYEEKYSLLVCGNFTVVDLE